MTKKTKELLDRLGTKHSLSVAEYELLLEDFSKETADYAAQKAVLLRKKFYHNTVYIRGLIETTNFCKNDCLYCGIRKSNKNCSRYRLTKDQIIECCNNGYKLGFRTFVLQGGEDAYFSDAVLCDIIKSIKSLFPDCAVTLSFGEREKSSYINLFNAGADRYLLRHETADAEHYSRLHPADLSLENRLDCLKNLKEIGFQTGCGFMVGSPYQTLKHIAKDLKFVETFSPHMCGIGPFIPHCHTPFKDIPAGSFELTLYLLSIVRLIKPNILLPSTTALGTVHPRGRELGILAGANVVMPNLSPAEARENYKLYNNKLNTKAEAAEGLADLKRRMEDIGYTVVSDRGDFKK